MNRTNHDPDDQLTLLADALLEHCPDDPDLGDPASWPSWTDEEVAGLGAPLGAEELFEPSPEDWKSYHDMMEQLEYERACNARFRP